ncbi:MAG: alpha,alpha-trehalase TreF [Cyclobacteriaceae bacterium]|nr:alpha,alpha-trehalase TreF [Cyclobacteriaceae bacterium]
MRLAFAIVLVLLFLSCNREETVNWDEVFGSSLFHDVQMTGVFPDSKTFPDCTPRTSWKQVITLYENARQQPGFDIREFVNQHFDLPQRPATDFKSDTLISMDEHLRRLWPLLIRPADKEDARSSRLSLPFPYVVPGGRFSEIYYWDSYFTMLGLMTHRRYADVRSMLNNFSFLINKYGHIPNGSRTYYLGRSQPPYFSSMIDLYQKNDSTILLELLSAMRKEYLYWMDGEEKLQRPGDQHRRVVMMPDGSVLNRYWDDIPGPRPEAYREDVLTARKSKRDAEEIYRNLRAAAESGWDFSSRWLEDPQRLETIRTTEIVPVDLNCLLYFTERKLQEAYASKNMPDSMNYFRQRADNRRRALLTFFWNEPLGFFTDYDFARQQQLQQKTLAGVYPLFFELSQPQMTERIARTLEQEFLKPGGLTTTLVASGQQWDAPNGWAPLQYLAISGLEKYGYQQLADEIKKRWLNLNEQVFRNTGKMMEKYNVYDASLTAGGGEYPAQDGFGWTNGVAAALLRSASEN